MADTTREERTDVVATAYTLDITTLKPLLDVLELPRYSEWKEQLQSEITKAREQLLDELSDLDSKTSRSFEEFYDAYQKWVEAKRREIKEGK